jgi:hypothetical protein
LLTSPKVLLRVEGAAVLLLAVTLYLNVSGDWLLFALLLLAPDIGMVGFLRDTRLGAATYNVCHTYVLPAVLALVALVGVMPQLLPFALIWFAHIGGDRLAGYGLKYPTAFRDTHLGRV